MQAVWFLKCKAINEKNWLDDTEMEEEGLAEILMDNNSIAQLPRYLQEERSWMVIDKREIKEKKLWGAFQY